MPIPSAPDLPSTVDHVFPAAGHWHYVCDLMVRGPFATQHTAAAELAAEQSRNRRLFPFRPAAALTVAK